VKKVQLRREGYDISAIDDPVYFFDASQKKYVPLDENLYQKLVNCEIRV